MWVENPRAWSLLALVAAAEAGARAEIPVGAVLTDPVGRPLALLGNRCVDSSDPLGHAEVRVLRLAAERVGNYRLPGTRLTVSLEPCPMCREAITLARISELRFAAPRPLELPAATTLSGFQEQQDAPVALGLLQFFFGMKRASLNCGVHCDVMV
ncbi:MAG: nucleoside deaminase [Magnetococcales bacterium]|nr:nucleoside deaminase [Magnetococcales bacterium]